MLSDRRPILLTNARIIDPSRNLDFPGDLLIADGVIREAKQGIGAAGVPEGTEVVDCKGKVMPRALTYARDFDALIVHHTEDPDLTGDGVMNEGEFAARLGLIGTPKAAETIMLERDMRLVGLTGGRYHAASVTCPESLSVLQ